MNFDFSEQETAFMSDLDGALGAFARDRDPESGDLEAVRGHLVAALGTLAPLGYLKIGLIQTDEPVSGTLALTAAMERLAGVSPSIFLAVEMSTRLFGRTLALGGPSQEGARIRRRLAAGELIGAVALSETAMNVENDPLTTTGIRKGDAIIVSGSKGHVVNGPLADMFAVIGRLDEGMAVFLIDRQAPGLKLDERQATMGYNGLAIGGLELEGCALPAGRVIGPLDADTCLGQLTQWENQILIAAALGMMQGSFAAARDHAKTHRSGGKPVIAYQEVGFKLAEMLTLYQAAQLYAYRAAWMADENPREAAVMTLCAKVFCTEAAESVAGKALQIQSASGYLTGGASERAYRCAKYGQIAGVSTEIARVKIGDAALGRR